jgi:hypothetical protein
VAESESSKPRPPRTRKHVGDLNEILARVGKGNQRVSSREDVDLSAVILLYSILHLHISSAS